jgi:PD-(D/E)XK nuclease superfamily
MSLSYTLLNTWAICPHQAARRFIIKDIPYETDAKRNTGYETHEAIANHIRGRFRLPENYRQYEPLVAPLVGTKPECKLAITGQCQPISFFAKDAWLRGVIDAHVIKEDKAIIFDWKTGKEWEDPFELEIFGLLLKSHNIQLKKVTGYYVWLRDNKLGEEHDVSDFAGTWGKVIKFHDEIEAGDFEKKTPGPLCKWCPVLDCSHNRKEK